MAVNLLRSTRSLWRKSSTLIHRGTSFSDDHAPNYYAILGVNRASDLKDIKMAYFRQAKKYHPDNNRSEEAKYMFLMIAEAYDVLSDEQKRKVRAIIELRTQCVQL